MMLTCQWRKIRNAKKITQTKKAEPKSQRVELTKN